jgi:hypothetical protein
LKVGVLVAHVQATARGGIHRHAWSLQEDLVERRVRTLGQRFDVLVTNLVVTDADLGQDVFSRGVERFRVRDNRAFSRRRSRRSGNDRCGCLGLLLWCRFGFGRFFGRGDGDLWQRGLATRAVNRGLHGERGESDE